MENLRNSIDKLLDAKPVYTEPAPVVDKGGFMQKMGKKMVSEEEIQRNKALNDFGFNQNSFNIDIMKTFIELQKYCKKLEKTIEENNSNFQRLNSAISILKKELDNVRLRSTLNSNQLEKMDAGLYKFSDKLEDYILTIAPGIRNSDCPKGCVETDISDTIGYYDRIETAKNKDNTEDLEKFCQTAITKNLSAMNAFEQIVIDFYGSDKYAAVLYGNLTRNSIYKVKLLKEGDIPKGNFSIICTDNAFVPRKLMLKSALVIVTAEHPFENVSADDIDNLKFLNECGLHTYITLNETAFREFRSNNFRCVRNIASDKLMTSELVRIVEKSIVNAVPQGAVSLGTLNQIIDNPDSYFLNNAYDIADYAKNKADVYPYNCFLAMEKAVSSAIKSSYFPTGIVSECRLSTTTEGKYSIIDGFNYINHLTYEDRKKEYSRAKTMLEPDGLFMINGYDAVIGIKVRSIKGWNYYPNFEALWTREQLIKELEDSGFKIKFIMPTGAGLFDNLPPKYRKTPAEWIIGATI